ncbi:MAG TPA: type II secretion system F family protein [Candidatus Binataceae bacterium]|jgi:tight adherence protein B
MTELVTILCFVLLVSPAVMHYMVGRRERLDREHDLERRLGNYEPRSRQSLTLAPLNPATERLVAALAGLPWIGRYLAETIRPASASTLLAIPVLFAGVTIAAASRLGTGGAALAGIAAAALPLLYLRKLRKRRLNLLSDQLPYLIDLLKSALESGHTILRALQMAGQNLPEPVSSELRLIVEQVQLGMTLPLALEAMYERAPIEELGFLVAALRVQNDVGNSLAEVLQHVSQGMRNRQRAEHQLHALTAQSRASAIIVTLLPFIVLAVFSLINPSYARPLFHNEYGVKMLETAIVLDAIAFLVMRRIARVNY